MTRKTTSATVFITTSRCDLQARRISRSRCSAESLDASGLQVIDPSMDFQLAARNLPLSKIKETSGYVSTVLYTTKSTAPRRPCGFAPFIMYEWSLSCAHNSTVFSKEVVLKHVFLRFCAGIAKHGKTMHAVAVADETRQLLVHRHVFSERKQDYLFLHDLLQVFWRRWTT